jgi:glycosyltransferase involved in cell wall biosynthesis
LGRRPGWDWRACWRLAAAWNRQPPEVIHTHNLGPLIYAVVARMLVPSLWRVPILHGEHGALQGDSLLPRRLRQRRWLYRTCRKVHTVSAGLRTELINHGFPSHHLVSVLNGVDCERFQPALDRANAKSTVGLPSDSTVLGCVGRFIATKRYPLLIEAFEKMAAKRPDLRLMMVGDGGTEKSAVLEQISKSVFRDRIHVLGHQANPAPFYQAMDLLVMPSSHEGLANALLEAMASGVAVMANSACGAAEVIESERSGFLYEIQDADQLTGWIEPLLANPALLREIGQQARLIAKTRFSLAVMVEGYLQLYQECAAVGGFINEKPSPA